jgi:hypothetical protein
MAFFQGEAIDLVRYLGVGPPVPPLVINAANNIFYTKYDFSGLSNWSAVVFWFKACSSVTSENGLPTDCDPQFSGFTDAFFIIAPTLNQAKLVYGSTADKSGIISYSSDTNDFQFAISGTFWIGLDYMGVGYDQMNFWAGTDANMTDFLVDTGNSTSQRFHTPGSYASNYVLQSIRIFGPQTLIGQHSKFEYADIVLSTYTGGSQFGLKLQYGQAAISEVRVLSEDLAVCMSIISPNNKSFSQKNKPQSPGCNSIMSSYCGPLVMTTKIDPTTGEPLSGVPSVPNKGPGYNDPQCGCMTSLVPMANCFDPVCTQGSGYRSESTSDCQGLTYLNCQQVIIANLNHVNVKGKGIPIEPGCTQGASNKNSTTNENNNGGGGDNNGTTNPDDSSDTDGVILFLILGGGGIFLLVFFLFVLLLVFFL